MDTRSSEPIRTDFMIVAACLVVVIAGLRAASGIVVPLLLAVFISLLCAGPFTWLKARKVPAFAAIILIIVLIASLFIALGTYIGVAANDFLQEIPRYQERTQAMLDRLTSWLSHYGIHIPRRMVDYLDPASILQIFTNILSGIGNAITWLFLILFTMIFVLMESQTFVGKIMSAFKSSPHMMETLGFIFQCVRKYLAIKTWISLATGISVMLWLFAIGVDYAVLWGILAFLFHSSPT